MDQKWDEFCQRYTLMDEEQRNTAWEGLDAEQKQYFQKIYQGYCERAHLSKASGSPLPLGCIKTVIVILLISAVMVFVKPEKNLPTKAPTGQMTEAPKRAFVEPDNSIVDSLIKGTLADWAKASEHTRAAAAVKMVMNVEVNRHRNYEGEQGKISLLADAYGLQICINEVAEGEGIPNMRVAEIAAACVILMDNP